MVARPLPALKTALGSLLQSDRTILVLGGSYGGLRAARFLADELGDDGGWQVVCVDRNSHFNRVWLLLGGSRDRACELTVVCSLGQTSTSSRAWQS